MCASVAFVISFYASIVIWLNVLHSLTLKNFLSDVLLPRFHDLSFDPEMCETVFYGVPNIFNYYEGAKTDADETHLYWLLLAVVAFPAHNKNVVVDGGVHEFS